METRARPTSRGRARCVSVRMERRREQTAAGPRAEACRLRRCALGDAALPRGGKGALPVCGGDAVYPCGAKALQSWRACFGLSREKTENRGALPIRNGWQARRGMRAVELCKAWIIACTIRRRGSAQEHPLTCLQPSHAHKSQLPVPSATPCFPCHPAGRPAGSARTRSRDPSLENPFWGNRPSPNVAGGKSPARGLAAVCAHSGPKRNESQPICPLLVGADRRQLRANGTGRRHCRPGGLCPHPPKGPVPIGEHLSPKKR